MSRLTRYKRAISPVVTTLFLFGVILGAIAVTLGIVYPQLQQLNDQMLLESAGSSLNSLDANIQSLILNGEDSSFFTEIKMGTSGLLKYDNQILSSLDMVETGVITPKISYNINIPRLMIVQGLDTNFLGKGEHQYFGGAGDQSTLYLNSTTRRLLTWSVINQSRPINSDDVSTSLQYRSIVSNQFDIIPNQLLYNLTVQIQMVNMTLASGSAASSSGARATIEVKFLGSSNLVTDWTKFNDNAALKITTQFPEAGSTNSIERPLSAEKPVDPTASFYIRFEFVYHNIEINIL